MSPWLPDCILLALGVLRRVKSSKSNDEGKLANHAGLKTKSRALDVGLSKGGGTRARV